MKSRTIRQLKYVRKAQRELAEKIESERTKLMMDIGVYRNTPWVDVWEGDRV